MTNKDTQEIILAFPSGMPESIQFCQDNSDKSIIGVSAIKDDPNNNIYDKWEYLPYVDTENFNRCFVSLVKKLNPKAIYCPHRFASHFIKHAIDKHDLNISIINNINKNETEIRNKQSDHWYAIYVASTQMLQIPLQTQLSKTELQSVVQHAISIPGETGVEKIIHLLAIGPKIVQGDVVEIGCLYGRTSFVFGWIARRFNLGHTLCVDPWNTEAAIHQDTSDMAREAIRENYNYDSIFQQFKEHLIPAFYGSLNYIRQTSDKAAVIFRSQSHINSSEFGNTYYDKSISCLHIDGNHDFTAVLSDINQWSSLLKDNSWIIIDDYHWPFGKGPKMVGDEILRTNKTAIENSFVAGDALFIKLKDKINTHLLFPKELETL